MSSTTKPVNQKAWFLVLPVILCVAFSAIVPLMTVVNYSVQDIGTYFLVTLDLAGQRLKSRLPADAVPPAAGSPVGARLLGAHTCFYANEELVA